MKNTTIVITHLLILALCFGIGWIVCWQISVVPRINARSDGWSDGMNKGIKITRDYWEHKCANTHAEVRALVKERRVDGFIFSKDQMAGHEPVFREVCPLNYPGNCSALMPIGWDDACVKSGGTPGWPDMEPRPICEPRLTPRW